MSADQKSFVLEVSLPSGPRQALFLEHFRALLPELFRTYTGQGSKEPTSGIQRRQFDGEVLVAPSQMQPTRIVLDFTPDGALPSIVALCQPPVVDAHSWHITLSQFFNRVLTSAFADRKSRFVQRAVLQYVGPALDGEYWFGGVRVAPADPHDSDPAVQNFERAVAIDAEIAAVDVHAAQAISTFRAAELGTKLSFLTDVRFYKPKAEAHWVSFFDGTVTRTIRAHLGFQYHSQTLPEMPRKGDMCQLGRYACGIKDLPIVDNLMTFPRETRGVLRAIGGESADPCTLKAFNAAARLTRVALELKQVAPSASLAYRVAAIEALAHHLQPSMSFSEFMRKWLPRGEAADSELNFLYGRIRSGHLHAGSFIAKEFDERAITDGFLDPELTSTYSVMAKVRFLTREAIANWLNVVVTAAAGP